MKTTTVVRLILGDQLNENHSWFEQINEHCVYVMMEVRTETDYVRHHHQKISALFAAMRRFAGLLRKKGHHVHYIRLSDPENKQSITENLRNLIARSQAELLEYQLPDEWRLDQECKSWHTAFGIQVRACDTEHFLTKRETLANFFRGRKNYLMEPFYRSLRKQFNLLMNADNTPVGGKWNFDSENRNRMPVNHVPPQYPDPLNDVSEIEQLLEKTDIETIGAPFGNQTTDLPLDRNQALAILHFFVREQLHHFGTFQDAMTPHSDYLYHSRLSFALNCKLISPLEVVETCINYAAQHAGRISLNQVEGFVRQIVGWREYIRGIYWAHMPDYRQLNYFGHTRKLPEWFWTGKTKMRCLNHAIGQSLRLGYAHHIQRLMVIGNFALLAEIHPDEMDEWYLGIYVDAFEWVQLPNTRGMSQYADGGLVGSKPYVSSAAYIDKMSNYCSTCFYKSKDKTGEKSCPFNSLYWNFFDRNASKLRNNPRIGMTVSTWERMHPEKRQAILVRAEQVLQQLNEL